MDIDGRREHRFQAIAVLERDVLGEGEEHGDQDDHEEHDPDAQRVVPLHLDDRQFIAAAAWAQTQAAHLPFPFFFFFFCLFLLLLFLRRLFLRAFQARGSSTWTLGYGCPYRFSSRVVASWVVPALPGAWPITVWPDRVGLVARFALLRLAGPGDVRVGVVVQVVVVDRRTNFTRFTEMPGARSIEGPLAGAEEGKPSALTPSGESTGRTRARVPTPMFSDSRLAKLRNPNVR